jgi:hypothetical protein
MKKLIFLTQIIYEKKEIQDLKQLNVKYSKVVIEVTAFKLNVIVATSSGGIWHFYDQSTSKEKKFNTDIDVLNFMYENGWVYKTEIESKSASVLQYLFEKKE